MGCLNFYLRYTRPSPKDASSADFSAARERKRSPIFFMDLATRGDRLSTLLYLFSLLPLPSLLLLLLLLQPVAAFQLLMSGPDSNTSLYEYSRARFCFPFPSLLLLFHPPAPYKDNVLEREREKKVFLSLSLQARNYCHRPGAPQALVTFRDREKNIERGNCPFLSFH